MGHSYTRTTSGSTTTSRGGSSSRTTGGSRSTTNTVSQTKGGSTSTTTSSKTYGSTTTTQGGGTSHTHSVTAATGKVDPKTQANLDKYSQEWQPSAELEATRRKLQENSEYKPSADVTAARQDLDRYGAYQPSPEVQKAYQNLQNTLDGRPPSFTSDYETQMNDLYQKILNRPAFHYNMNADSLYMQYRDQYVRNGRNAMNDTLASANAQTGGYSSSYSQAAAQQQYQNYLAQLNDIVPQLQQNAFSQYQYEGAQMQQNFQNAGTLYSRDFNKWRSDVEDWQNDRNFALQNYQGERQMNYNEFNGDRNFALDKYSDLANIDWNQFAQNRAFYADRYDSDRSFEYNKYNNDRNYWNQEYWNERNAEKTTDSQTDYSNWSTSSTTGWENSTSTTNSTNWSTTNTKSTTDTSNWSNTDTTNWSTQNTTGWQNSDTYTPDTGSSGGGGSYRNSRSKGSGLSDSDLNKLGKWYTTDQYGNYTGNQKGRKTANGAVEYGQLSNAYTKINNRKNTNFALEGMNSDKQADYLANQVNQGKMTLGDATAFLRDQGNTARESRHSGRRTRTW